MVAKMSFEDELPTVDVYFADTQETRKVAYGQVQRSYFIDGMRPSNRFVHDAPIVEVPGYHIVTAIGSKGTEYTAVKEPT
jgi:hypothetical protein